MKLRIAILGTRGIPNNYGGYEQAVTYLSQILLKKGHSVTVYNSHSHPNQERNWQGVEIVHCYDPENKIGAAGQFIYDWNCILDCRKKNYDVILMMGYTSSSVWGKWFPKKSIIISNMDGLEWKRSKYSKPVQYFLRHAEKLAVKYSNFHIADSPAIKKYLDEKYAINSHYIPYGAVLPEKTSTDVISSYQLQPGNYYLLIARIEPENNIELILDGFLESNSEKIFFIVGNTNNKYGDKIKAKYSVATNIIFAEAIFDQTILQNLRTFCCLYFHGHSVGGTNPSLLEAMAAGAGIAAHDNAFNKSILGADGIYFTTSSDITTLLKTKTNKEEHLLRIKRNVEKIKDCYNWEKVGTQYENYIVKCYALIKK